MHQAADGGLARVRLPGGVLTPAQLRVLTAASVELGDGNLELTSRANVQIRALRAGAPQELSERLYAAGLLPSITHERVRNILASPLSGLDQQSLYDVLPVVGELDRLLCAHSGLASLPGRFLFAVDDGRGDLAAVGADVAVRMVSPDQATLLLAGTNTGVLLSPAEIAPTMLAATEAFLAERTGQSSSAWRLSELPNGPANVLARLGLHQKKAPQARMGWSGLEAGRYEQVDGDVALVVTVPLGSLSAGQAGVLAGLGEQAAGELRVARSRSIVVPGVRAVDQAVERLAGVGLVVEAGSPWDGVTACAGRPGCGKALADVRGDARRVTPGLPGRHRAVHWSGCERRCGQPAGEFVDVLALTDGYSIDGSPAVTIDLRMLSTALRPRRSS